MIYGNGSSFALIHASIVSGTNSSGRHDVAVDGDMPLYGTRNGIVKASNVLL